MSGFTKLVPYTKLLAESNATLVLASEVTP